MCLGCAITPKEVGRARPTRLGRRFPDRIILQRGFALLLRRWLLLGQLSPGWSRRLDSNQQSPGPEPGALSKLGHGANKDWPMRQTTLSTRFSRPPADTRLRLVTTSIADCLRLLTEYSALIGRAGSAPATSWPPARRPN